MNLLLCSDDDQDNQYDYENKDQGTKEDQHNLPVLQIVVIIFDRCWR